MDENAEGSAEAERVLRSLATHSALIARSLRGSITLYNEEERKAGAALERVGAFRPEAQDTYFLHPGLRGFLADHLKITSAFEALTRIKPEVDALDSTWLALCQLRPSQERDRLEEQLQHKASNIRFYITRNLSLLMGLVSSQYGNVDGLRTKLRQNRFYISEIAQMLDELSQIDVIARKISESADAYGAHDIQLMMQRMLIAPRYEWVSQARDCQQEISRRLLKSRQLEEQLFRLSQVARWLAAHPERDGFEVPVRKNPPDSLLSPTVIELLPRADVADENRMMQGSLLQQARSLPRLKKPLPEKELQPEPRSVLVSVDPAPMAVQLSAEEQATARIEQRLRVRAEPLSLAEWRRSDPTLHAMPMEAWLFYAGRNLAAKRYRTFMRFEGPGGSNAGPFPINDPFDDIVVVPKKARAV